MMMKKTRIFKFSPSMFVVYLVGFCFTHMVCFGANVSLYESNMEIYIIHLRKPEAGKVVESEDLEALYGSFVPRHRIVHSYRHVMNGFAARLTATEAEDMKEKEGLLYIRPQRILSLQTTHTPTFLGLHGRKGPQLWLKTKGRGVIIGVVDTGITPYHPSFSGKDIDPPPNTWSGRCDLPRTACNNKLIGARNMVDKTKLPIDELGHGTHTASTAAGNLVKGASFLGQAYGTAAGMAPHAHLAIYKVCSQMFCDESAVIAGMEAAIADGVHVLSLSLGGGALPLYKDSLEIAAFAAVRKGIFVSCAAGNDGPISGTVTNISPWILTVGASTVDRTFPATVVLGNGQKFVGESFLQPKPFKSVFKPLVFPGADGTLDQAFCHTDFLEYSNVKGKVVLCETSGEYTQRVAKGEEVKRVGGYAMILINSVKYEGPITYDEAHVLPTSHVSYEAGEKIKDYITRSWSSSRQPEAKLNFEGTVFGSKSAPMVAKFSSRGPNPISLGILKPDILGPGVNILAAWPNLQDKNNDIQKNPPFAMLSGTSMATPCLSGIIALLISSHPDWTPPMIKSALMTTAYTKNLGDRPITDDHYGEADLFDIGAGHVDPSRANDPGLVYDINIEDEVGYLCGLQYTDIELQTIIQDVRSCGSVKKILGPELNYPTFSIGLGIEPRTKTVDRTVKNVGPTEATYILHFATPHGVNMTVEPEELIFREDIKELSYSVTFDRLPDAEGGSMVEGHLSWVYNEYIVRSPIVVTFV